MQVLVPFMKRSQTLSEVPLSRGPRVRRPPRAAALGGAAGGGAALRARARAPCGARGDLARRGERSRRQVLRKFAFFFLRSAYWNSGFTLLIVHNLAVQWIDRI